MTFDTIAAPLAETQAWLLAAVTAEATASLAQTERHLVGSATFSAVAGLAIYRRAYRARLATAMRTQFPAACHALGEALFDDFVGDYIRAFPPSSYTLHDLGRRFAGFLEGNRPDRDASPDAREDWIDFIVELARFERLVFMLYDAPGAEDRTRPGAKVADERLWLQPAVRLDAFAFNVADYHTAVRRGRTPPNPSRDRCDLAIVRSDHVVRIMKLDAIEAALCRVMREGRSFAEALDCVPREQKSTEQVRALAPQIRGRWTRWGMFVDRS